MTEEKKKRGRPRKIESPQTLKEEFHETKELVDIKINQLKEEYPRIGKSIDTEKLIPPAGLSKVATLQWLTEKRNKK